jgi:IS5 family transposase
MSSFIDFALNEEYERVKQLGDRLMEIESVIDRGGVRLIVRGMYENRSERGGRPNIDEVLMVKLLVLQQ